MALLIPEILPDDLNTTAGERTLFTQLKNVLPASVTVRFEMILGERERRPDFVAIDPNRGVLIIEVKDWSVERIEQASERQFRVRGMGGARSIVMLQNPYYKCDLYLNDARNQLIAMESLHDEWNKLNVPISSVVAFPNISSKDFHGKGLNQVIPTERVWFREDIKQEGVLRYRYNELLPLLDSPLSVLQIEEVTKALWPDLAIPHIFPGLIKKDGQTVVADSATIETYNLSVEQETLAKSIGEGPRLLRGIAGTGKTLVMLYRAKLLAANLVANKKGARILILCWNVSLANYMEQIYERLAMPNTGHVTICNFSQFVRNYCKYAPAALRDLDTEDQNFMSRLRLISISEKDKYDAIYIDEAQDFRKEWIEFLFDNLLHGVPEKRHLLIAADDAQRIYNNRDYSWESLKIPIKSDSTILKTICRNSARIWTFAAFLLEEKATYVGKGDLQFAPKKGINPVLRSCDSPQHQVIETVKIVKKLLANDYAARNVLILYKGKTTSSGYDLIENLLNSLRSEQIPVDWITEAKRNFQWENESVKVSTVHSAKGMDAPVVILLAAEMFDPSEGRDQNDTKLLYVALTRARETLLILHSGNDGLVPKLYECQKKYESARYWISRMELGTSI